MLTPYFAFGVPLFLLVLYFLFLIIRKKTSIPYIRFVLLLIGTFMMVFSFQVIQQYWTIVDAHATSQLQSIRYDPKLLWIPFLTGAVLASINIWQVFKQLKFIDFSN